MTITVADVGIPAGSVVEDRRELVASGVILERRTVSGDRPEVVVVPVEFDGLFGGCEAVVLAVVLDVGETTPGPERALVPRVQDAWFRPVALGRGDCTPKGEPVGPVKSGEITDIARRFGDWLGTQDGSTHRCRSILGDGDGVVGPVRTDDRSRLEREMAVRDRGVRNAGVEERLLRRRPLSGA